MGPQHSKVDILRSLREPHSSVGETTHEHRSSFQTASSQSGGSVRDEDRRQELSQCHITWGGGCDPQGGSRFAPWRDEELCNKMLALKHPAPTAFPIRFRRHIRSHRPGPVSVQLGASHRTQWWNGMSPCRGLVSA